MFNGYEGPDEAGSWEEPDFLLSYLVSTLVNLSGAPLGITLLVKGVVITGTLISERDYLSTLSHMLQTQIRRSLNNMTEDERKMAESAFDLTDLTEDFYPDDNDEDGELEMHPIQYLHLRDPLIVSPQPTVGFAKGAFPVMRIRLTTVDGWMLGTSLPGFPDLPTDGGIQH
ncbi:MAG: hypothetical protein K8L99_35980 [Anaerolineae bacterium]|nr:hypothetical protein [Anaerolineae bacterium]